MRLDRLPITYDECRARVRRAVTDAGLTFEAHPLQARGPHGQELTIDIATIGPREPERALLVLSGVHGVEGFVTSTLQTDLVGRLDPDRAAAGVAVVIVHVVNPWGMAHDRRQNESNVDLNRNWRRSSIEPDPNESYDRLHGLVCPDTTGLPDVDELLAAVAPIVSECGTRWVVDAITTGQYEHPDGLHFGGVETEESCRIIEREVPRLLGSARRVLTADLHTGAGPYGALTLLSSRPRGSDQDRFLRAAFGEVEVTVQDADSVSSVKSGPIAAGIADVLPAAECFAVTPEFGTAGDMAQLAATYHEQWVHRHGDPSDPAHEAARRRYRECFTPDDAGWERQTLAHGRVLLDRAVAAVDGWV